MASQAELNAKLDEALVAVNSIAARIVTPPAIDFAPEVAKAQAIVDAANATAPVAP